MRVVLTAFLLCVISGCTDAPPPVVDRIELRLSGWSAVDITVSRQGASSYHLSDPPPAGKGGIFSLTPQQFENLLRRLEPYRKTAVSFTDASAEKFVLSECPRGVPFVTDQGAFYVRWIGRTSDQHYLADLGCDSTRLEARNKDLLAIAQSLPVPLD
jgi:hypothetical protein